MLTFKPLDISGVYAIEPRFLSDDRGGFFRFYCEQEFAEITDKRFVQMNHSVNHKKGTLRGMHYQLPPHAEQKIVRCVKGAIWDVFVDLRENSPTFLQWDSIELTENNRTLLFLPEGIAHGFITLEDDSHVLYQHSEFYAPYAERGIRFDDPKIGIDWPFEANIISERDNNHPYLNDDFKGIQL